MWEKKTKAKFTTNQYIYLIDLSLQFTFLISKGSEQFIPLAEWRHQCLPEGGQKAEKPRGFVTK